MELLSSALEKLGKSEIEAPVQEAIDKHKTAFLQKRLNIKATHKKSRVRMIKKDMGYAKLFTQEDVNAALEQYKAKQKKFTEVTIRKKEKKGRGSKGNSKKGKGVVRNIIALPTTSVALGSGFGTQVSDSEENIGLRVIVISSDTFDSEVSEASEPYIQRIRKVLTTVPGEVNTLVKQPLQSSTLAVAATLFAAIAVFFAIVAVAVLFAVVAAITALFAAAAALPAAVAALFATAATPPTAVAALVAATATLLALPAFSANKREYRDLEL
ncbi:MAG: hypothetical protein M1840_001197 [Geoglossum simile]|nr:MAG: hypothetical protein M1840_001197 [Geoglossum simile]